MLLPTILTTYLIELYHFQSGLTDKFPMISRSKGKNPPSGKEMSVKVILDPDTLALDRVRVFSSAIRFFFSFLFFFVLKSWSQNIIYSYLSIYEY